MRMISPSPASPVVISLSVVCFAAAAAAPVLLDPFGLRIGHSIFLGAGLALSWFVLSSFTSYFSFGHTAFVGIGAFGAAILQQHMAIENWALQFVVGLAVGILACMAIAAAIAWPILRLRGPYFTIAMLALALISGEVVNSFDTFGGAIGIAIRPIGSAWAEPELFFYYVLLIALALTVLVVYLLKRSRFGYGLMSIRENEDAAEMLGVPTVWQKSLCFVLSAGICGGFGAILAFNLGYITTASVFREQLSLEVILYCLLGGMSSIAGPIVGSAVFTLLTKVVFSDFLEVHLALTGVVMIIVVLAVPNGIVGGAGWALKRLTKRLRSTKALNG